MSPRDAVLGILVIFFVIQNNDYVVECLDACGCRQINFVEERINDLGVNFFFKYKCKGSVASLQFGLSNLFKALFVAILYVGIASNLFYL